MNALVFQAVGRIDPARVDATTQADMADQQAADEGDAAGCGPVRLLGRKTRGPEPAGFSRRIKVALDTICNAEQGKRCPTGAATALRKVRVAVLAALP